MKRPALQDKQVGVLRFAFGARKVSGLSRNGPLYISEKRADNASHVACRASLVRVQIFLPNLCFPPKSKNKVSLY